MKKQWGKRACALFLSAGLAITGLAGCTAEKGTKQAANDQSSTDTYQVNEKLDTTKEVNLILAGTRPDYKAMEQTMKAFEDIYPNCTIQYEYIQDYDNNLPARLTSDTDRVDLFMSFIIQGDSLYYDNAYDLLTASDQVDLTGTLPGIIENATCTDTSDASKKALYAVPMGGEMRGMYVNTTLLDSLNVKVPTNQSEFLAACKTIQEAGYIPLQSNPGTFGQHMMYPEICNMVNTAQNKEEVYNMINTADEQTAEYLREPLSFLYDLMVNNYYEYKRVETETGRFVDSDFDTIAKDFLGIKKDGDTFAKTDDVGEVAFMPSPNSLQSYIEKNKEDYHSGISYEFILAPVSEDGGFAYLSPAMSLAVNKQSQNLDWDLEFMNYFFQESNNKAFAKTDNLIPNTADALEYISENYEIPVSQITQVGSMTFSYGFYNMLVEQLIDISKGNNPKYMQDDGAGGVKVYDFEHYMDNFKKALKEQQAQM